jgi:hypothetical protein
MRYFAAALTSVAVSLWFGGLVTLAIAVMAVFLASGLDRPTAGKATAAIFVWFGRVQLVIAAVGLIGAFLGYVQGRRRLPMAMFVLLAIATVGAVVFNTHFVTKMEALRLAGDAQSAEFQSMHKQSERLMQGMTLVLFAAAAMLPAFARSLWTLAGTGPGFPVERAE